MKHALPICSVLLFLSASAVADVRLPDVLCDHMVLQQQSDAVIWGWAYGGETVIVEASWGVKAKTAANDKGEWKVVLKTPAAQTLDNGLHPENITISVPNENMVQIKDILIGEVWVCSGQSNMAMMPAPEYPAGRNAWFGEAFWKEESLLASRPALRLFNVEKAASPVPRDNCRGAIPDHLTPKKDENGLLPEVKHGWQPCTLETANNFSSVAYYFGSRLQQTLNIPVGLIHSSVGGTGIESWVGLPALRTVKGYEGAGPSSTRGGAAAHFNAMIAPLTPMKIRGVIWYQGESNVGNENYAKLFETLIGDWRKSFDCGDFPFYFVQIAPSHSGGLAAAKLREAQSSALQLPHTGMALTMDVSDANNIHPSNKRDVGIRLSLQALSKTYGIKDVVADGPVFQALALKDGKLRVSFRDVGGGLQSRDGKPLNCFQVAGVDGKFVPATAVIEGDEVVISNVDVDAPKAVRFSWGDADFPNLMCKDGLPVAQFRAEVK